MENKINNLPNKEKADKLTRKLAEYTKSGEVEKASFNEEYIALQHEIENLKSENFNIKTISALEKSGCIKPELVAKSVPEDCADLQEWIDRFKSENEILFRQPAQNHGGNFKPAQSNNLSPTELMNNYIRGIK